MLYFSKTKSKPAFTIMELVISILVVGVIAGVMVPLISSSFDTWYYVLDRREILYQARLAMQRMVREIRQVRDNNSFVTTAASQLQFIDINDNSIDFDLQGSTITRNSEILARDVQTNTGLDFTYLDEDGNVTGTSTEIRTIVIHVITQTSGRTLDMESQVSPRNLQ